MQSYWTDPPLIYLVWICSDTKTGLQIAWTTCLWRLGENYEPPAYLHNEVGKIYESSNCIEVQYSHLKKILMHLAQNLFPGYVRNCNIEGKLDFSYITNFGNNRELRKLYYWRNSKLKLSGSGSGLK